MTDLRTNLTLALQALSTQRLRAFLTILGLTMGVATLMAVITLILGANTFVADKVANLGTGVFRIAKTPFASTDFEENVRARRNPDIGLEHLRAIREACPLCEQVGATASGRVSVRYRNQELRDVTLNGYTPNMIDINTRAIERGRYFSSSEDRHAARICVLGSNLVEQLFPGVDPIGRWLRVGQDEMLVIGAYERIGSVLGQDQDSYVVVPLTTFFSMQGSRHSLTLEIKAAGADTGLGPAQDQARLIMRAGRGIRGSQKEDFYIGTAASYIALWEAISSTFVIVFISVSAIAALVGGIVIMNIMLISVTERTKEIGVRRACGARRADIIRQFLTESLLVCMIGGVCGVALGFGVAVLLRTFTAFPADVRWWAAAFGVVFSSGVGLFFGIYPAIKAADLDPVEALRD
jgi:putative ABC transport system permease protein